jgi:hypothetical protein
MPDLSRCLIALALRPAQPNGRQPVRKERSIYDAPIIQWRPRRHFARCGNRDWSASALFTYPHSGGILSKPRIAAGP